MEKRIGVYAGSFDPITNGHMWIVQTASEIVDELIVAVGVNPEKKYTFSLEDRLDSIKKCLGEIENVKVDHFSNKFLVEYAKEVGAKFIIRGMRTQADYEFEKSMMHINRDLNPNIRHIFLMPPRELNEISSSLVKGLVGPVGWKKIVRNYVPEAVQKLIENHFEASLEVANGEKRKMELEKEISRIQQKQEQLMNSKKFQLEGANA